MLFTESLTISSPASTDSPSVDVPELRSGHRPVMLAEAIAWLNPHPGGMYLDGTFGGGGHAQAILHASAPDGRLIALDADHAAIERGRELIKAGMFGERLTVVQANFADLDRVVRDSYFAPVDGVLLDLGLSSFQLDDASRGFSFRFGGPLDMRFDQLAGDPTSHLVNTLPADELANLIYRYGEEPKSRRIAAAIVRERAGSPIETADRLADIVASAVGGRRGHDTHPATRTFQALRIFQNDELAVLERGLEAAVRTLAPDGRLVVIAFHSLEDRIVKQFMAHESATCICPPEIPVCICDHQPRLRRLTNKAIRPGAAEVAANPRSRSAILRATQRLPDGSDPLELSDSTRREVNGQ